jgi:hypothetical protein
MTPTFHGPAVSIDEAGIYSDVMHFDQRHADIPPSAEVRLAEQKRLAEQAAITDALGFAEQGRFGEAAATLEAALAEGDNFAVRRHPQRLISTEVIGNGSPRVDDAKSRARAEAQAEANAEAAAAAPARAELLAEYERPSAGHTYPGQKP